MTPNTFVKLPDLLNPDLFDKTLSGLVYLFFPYMEPEVQARYEHLYAEKGVREVIEAFCRDDLGRCLPFAGNIHDMLSKRGAKYLDTDEARAGLYRFAFNDAYSANRGNANHMLNVTLLAAHFLSYAGDKTWLNDLTKRTAAHNVGCLLAAALYHDLGKTVNNVNHATSATICSKPR